MSKNNWTVWLVAAACACFAVQRVAAQGDEAEHEALRRIKVAYEEAIKSNDLSKMAPYLSPNTSGVMLTAEEVKGLPGLQAYWDKIKAMMGEGGRYEVTLKPNRSELFGDVALAHGSTDDVVRAGNGKTYQFGSLWTAVCRKEDGQWKVLRLQGTMDPIANPFANARVQFNRLMFGAGGAIAGLVLGLALGLAKRRKAP